MVALEFIRTYLDDLLCITKASLDDHLWSLETSPYQVASSGLESQFPKIKIPCCGNGIPREYPHKDLHCGSTNAQAILAITLPQQVKDLRRFLDMVQSYRDLWARCSEMLAPFTSLGNWYFCSKIILF
jgi:hypothetical protein